MRKAGRLSCAVSVVLLVGAGAAVRQQRGTAQTQRVVVRAGGFMSTVQRTGASRVVSAPSVDTVSSPPTFPYDAPVSSQPDPSFVSAATGAVPTGYRLRSVDRASQAGFDRTDAVFVDGAAHAISVLMVGVPNNFDVQRALDQFAGDVTTKPGIYSKDERGGGRTITAINSSYILYVSSGYDTSVIRDASNRPSGAARLVDVTSKVTTALARSSD